MAVVLAACGGGGGVIDGPLALPAGVTTSAPPLVTTTTVAVDPAIRDLMDGAGMTPYGRNLFLAVKPAIEDKATLLAACAGARLSADDTFHLLGCYGNNRIHLRVPAAPELHDYVYVAAAHELLHVAFAGVTGGERVRLVEELAAVRASASTIEAQLRPYPARLIDDELHSLVGTQVSGLSAFLEAHFAKYFDRARVAAAYGRSLEPWDAEVNRIQKQHDESKARLDAMRAEIEALQATGETRAANALIDTFNAAVREHNALVAEVRARNDELNRLLEG